MGIEVEAAGNCTRNSGIESGPIFCNKPMKISTNGLLNLATYSSYVGHNNTYFISSAHPLSDYKDNVIGINDDNISDFFKFISKNEMNNLIIDNSFTTASC